jgi:hypothetical protein
MSTTVRYIPPSAAAYRDMATGPEIRAACSAVAHKGMAYATGISPRSKKGDKEHYQDSFQVVEATVLWAGRPRAAARMENTVGWALLVERTHNIFQRTLDYLRSQAG